MFVIDPYKFGPTIYAGRTFLQLNSDVTNISNPYTVTWPSSVRDDLSAYSGGNPTRLTVPVAGDYVLYASVTTFGQSAATGLLAVEIAKNGSRTWKGMGAASASLGQLSGGASTGRACQTPIISCSSGDYFEVVILPESTSVDLSGTDAVKTQFMLYKVPSFRGVLVDKSSDQSATPDFVVTWANEQYDTDSMFTVGTSATNIIAPGTGYVSATVNLYGTTTNATDSVGITFTKSAATVVTSLVRAGATSGGNFNYSGPSACTSGNVMTFSRRSSSTSASVTASKTSAGVEFHTRQSCRVGVSALITGVNATGAGYVPVLNTELFDDANIWSSGAPTRLTSPGGWVQVGAAIIVNNITAADSIVAQVEHYNSSGTLLATFKENGYSNISSGPRISVLTPHVNTVSGDYFLSRVIVSSDTSIDVNPAFWMEVYAA